MSNGSMTGRVGELVQKNKVLVYLGFLLCAFGYIILKDNPPRVLLYGIALISAVVFLWNGLFRQDVLTYLFVAYIPFSRELPVDFGNRIPGFNLTNIFIGLLTFFWLKNRSKAKTEAKAFVPLKVPIFLFWALGFFSVYQSVPNGLGYFSSVLIQYYRVWVAPLVVYFIILNSVRDKETIKNVVIVLMMVTVLVGLMAVYEYRDTDERVGGIFDEPNFLGAFFNYYMFLPLGFFLMNMGNKLYWLFLIPFLICFRGVMVTFSRAAYLAFATGLYGITFFSSKFLMVLLILVTLFLFKNPAFLPEGIRYRFAQTFEKPSIPVGSAHYTTEALDKSTSDRFRLWNAASWMIQEHPVFGVGYNAFEPRVLHYYPGSELYDPHNSYLLIASEMGIPALLIFIWILLGIFWGTWQVYRKTKDPFMKAFALGFLGGFFSLLMSNLYGSRFNSAELSYYFWILAALLMRLKLDLNKENQS
jgi:putative inorganic carbon (HCO3(-)) transporter